MMRQLALVLLLGLPCLMACSSGRSGKGSTDSAESDSGSGVDTETETDDGSSDSAPLDAGDVPDASSGSSAQQEAGVSATSPFFDTSFQ